MPQRSPQVRSKEYGRETEHGVWTQLHRWLPGLRRTGSVAYKRAAADLVQDGGTGTPIRIVATRDKHMPVLVTMSAYDLYQVLCQVGDNDPRYMGPVVVQVKGRGQTWVGRVWRDLRDATK